MGLVTVYHMTDTIALDRSRYLNALCYPCRMSMGPVINDYVAIDRDLIITSVASL